MTNDASAGLVRLPAEWEGHGCVLLAWPHKNTDWAYMLEEARDCVASIIRAVSVRECVLLIGPADKCLDSVRSYGFDGSRVRFADVDTNDTWARDFGPITVETPEGFSTLDFKFNAWGMKFAADKDNLINVRLALKGIFKGEYVNHLSFVLEGGSIESDGRGTLLTTAECLLSPNRNGGMSESEIRRYLASTLGFSQQLWLHSGTMAGDDTDSHIDTLARLAPHDTILYTGARDSSGHEVAGLAKMRDELRTFLTKDNQPFNLVELPLPDPIYDEDGMQLPATYANYLVSDDAVYLPIYGQPANDFLASQTLRVIYPDHEIVTVDCLALIKQHGSLHCVTMQLPKGAVDGITDGYWNEKIRNL